MKTGMKAWVGQRQKDVARNGKRNSPWLVFWNEPDGKRREKSCGPGKEGWRLAQKEKVRIHNELVSGMYKGGDSKTWKQFRESYETKVMVKKGVRTQGEIKTALDHFETLCSPCAMRAINTETIDDYIAARRKERGKKKGEVVSPATINKELRHLRATLRKAHRWGYLPLVPDFDFEAEPTKLVRYITQEHFALLYKACGEARRPDKLPYAPASWWRALLVYCYQGTGWRISELLALRREDLDLDAGTAVTRHDDNKGNRTEQIKLHAVVLEHLKTIPSFDSRVFPWDHDRKALDKEFHRLQGIAGIHLLCREDHEHTPTCHVYGFHDLRRGFASMNAGALSSDALQALMRHKSYATTQRYINMAPQMDKAIEALHIPEVLRQQLGGK